MKLKITYRNTITEALKGIEREIRPEMENMGHKFIEQVVGEAIDETPLLTGNLRGAFFGKLAATARKMRIIIGNTANYAFWVHEDLSAHHDVGKAQFLIDPVLRNHAQLNAELADGVRRIIARNKRKL